MPCPSDSCYRHHKQDSFWSWFIVLTATLGDGITLAMTYCYAVILPVLVREFKQTRQNAAWVSSITYSLMYLAAPISAFLCVRLGNRWTAVIGIIACIVSLISSSFSSSLELLYFTFGILLGVGSSFLHVAGILLIQRYFDKKRALATGIFATSSSCSAMLGPLFQVLIDNLQWRKTFRIISLWLLAPLVLVLVFYSSNVDDGTNKEDTKKVRSRSWCGLRKITCSYWNSWFTIGAVVIGLQSFGMFFPLSHLVKHCNEVGYPEEKSTMLLVYIGVSSLVGKVAAGRILDSPRVCVYWMNQLATCIIAVSIFILKYAVNDVGFILFALLYGISLGAFIPAQYVLWMSSVAPENRPAALATGEVFASVGLLVGPPFIGFLADEAGSYKLAFTISAAVVLGATLLLFFRFCFEKPSFERRETIEYLCTTEEELIERETVL